MIINFYIPDQDAKLVDKLKSISNRKRRSFSFVVREALEHYLYSAATKNISKKREV